MKDRSIFDVLDNRPVLWNRKTRQSLCQLLQVSSFVFDFEINLFHYNTILVVRCSASGEPQTTEVV